MQLHCEWCFRKLSLRIDEIYCCPECKLKNDSFLKSDKRRKALIFGAVMLTYLSLIPVYWVLINTFWLRGLGVSVVFMILRSPDISVVEKVRAFVPPIGTFITVIVMFIVTIVMSWGSVLRINRNPNLRDMKIFAGCSCINLNSESRSMNEYIDRPKCCPVCIYNKSADAFSDLYKGFIVLSSFVIGTSLLLYDVALVLPSLHPFWTLFCTGLWWWFGGYLLMISMSILEDIYAKNKAKHNLLTKNAVEIVTSSLGCNESQRLCPVDDGYLLDKSSESVIQEALNIVLSEMKQSEREECLFYKFQSDLCEMATITLKYFEKGKSSRRKMVVHLDNAGLYQNRINCMRFIGGSYIEESMGNDTPGTYVFDVYDWDQPRSNVDIKKQFEVYVETVLANDGKGIWVRLDKEVSFKPKYDNFLKLMDHQRLAPNYLTSKYS